MIFEKMVDDVYQQGVIAIIEQFTLNIEELRLFVVYSYYDKDWNLLYIGRSRSFYNTHYFNSERLEFFDDVHYVGFLFFKNDEEIIEAKKFFKKIGWIHEELIVTRKQMERRWHEWLG